MRLILTFLLLPPALVGVGYGQPQEQSVSVQRQDLTQLQVGERLLLQPAQTLLPQGQPATQMVVTRTNRKALTLTVQWYCPESAPQPVSSSKGANRPIRTEAWADGAARWTGYVTWLVAFLALLYWQRERLARLIKAAVTRRK